MTRITSQGRCVAHETKTDLETLVLQDLLDSNVLHRLGDTKLSRLEDDTKRAIPDDFAVGVFDFGLLSAHAVGREHGDDALGIIVECWEQVGQTGG
jgi:hypothetical protein